MAPQIYDSVLLFLNIIQHLSSLLSLPMHISPNKSARDLVILVFRESDLCPKCGFKMSSQVTAAIEFKPEEMELDVGYGISKEEKTYLVLRLPTVDIQI